MRTPLLLLMGLVTLCSCNDHKFDHWNFNATTGQMLQTIDSFYIRQPYHKVPLKWTIEDSYSYDQKRNAFSNERRFYFLPPNEEMYSIQVLDVDEKSQIIINAVHDSSQWNLESDLSSKEIQRIEDRFDRYIIPVLEKIAGEKSSREH